MSELNTPAHKFDTLKEVRVQGVPPRVHEQIKNIAACAGVSVSELVKPWLTKMVEDYPERARSFKPIS